MDNKLKSRALSKFEAGRDVWQEVLHGVREIKSGGGKRSVVEPPLAPLYARVKRHRKAETIMKIDHRQTHKAAPTETTDTSKAKVVQLRKE